MTIDKQLSDVIKHVCERSSITDKGFVNQIADYAPEFGFILEERVKSVLKVMCADTNVQNIISKKRQIPDFEIRHVQSSIVKRKGFDESLVHDTLRHLLIGTGCNIPSTIGVKTVVAPSNKVINNPVPAVSTSQPSNHPKQKPFPPRTSTHLSSPQRYCSSKNKISITYNKPNASFIKEDFLWLWENADYISWGYFCMCVVIFLVSLVAIVIGWYNDLGHAPVWTWLFWESLVIGTISMCIGASKV